MALLIVGIVSAQAQVSFSDIPNQIPVGTRPSSLAEAFTAVVDDGYAAYWNPAGMARLDGLRLTFSYSDLYNFDIDNIYGSVTTRPYLFPQLIDNAALGAYWNIIQSIDSQTGQKDFDRSQFGFSLALQPPRAWPWLYNLRAGATAKYFQESISYPTNDGPVLQGDYGGWGYDLGLLYGFDAVPFLPNGLTFGMMIHDIGGTSVKHPEQNGERFEETINSQTTHWALSYRPFEDWPWGSFPISEPLVTIELDDRVHVGMELVLAKTLVLRGGMQWSRNGEERGTSLAFGLGVKQNLWGASRRFEVDYAATDSPVLPNTGTQFGGALVFDENPRLIRFQVAEINDVFASLHKHYASEAGELGRVVLYNRHDDSLLVDVTFRAEPYTRKPVPQSVVVPARGIKEVALRAFLDPEIINARPRERMTCEIEAVYSLPYRGSYTTRQNVKYTLHGAGYLTWDDPNKVAAFVTKEDRCINEFAKAVVTQPVSSEATLPFFTRNMNYALKLYEALNAMGFDYVPDVKTPFYTVGQTQQVVDQIRYPADLLASTRAGDCDDLAVLYATLLESIGVETALLVTPQHIFMMLNTDLPERRHHSLPLTPEKFVAYRGTLWLPVETTAFPAPFSNAWHVGAVMAHAALAADTVAIVDVALNQSENRFQPADKKFLQACEVKPPEIAPRIRQNITALTDSMREYSRAFEVAIAADPSASRPRNAYAAILAHNGEIAHARTLLDTALQWNPQSASALNNLGNIAFITDRLDEAETYYLKALRYNTYNQAGTHLNLALLYALQITESDKNNEALLNKCRGAMKEAGRWLNDDPELAAAVLGLMPNTIQGKGGKFEVVKREQEYVPAPEDTAAQSVPFTPQDRSGVFERMKKIWEALTVSIKQVLQGHPPPPPESWLGPKGSRFEAVNRSQLLWWDL